MFNKPLAVTSLVGVLLALVFRNITLLKSIFDYNIKQNTLLTPQELSLFDGIQSQYLYLAILGKVFNVTQGAKHYGANQQYHFFVGKDASRAFVTGQFEDDPDNDNVIGLREDELRALNGWVKFYKKEYNQVGKVIGRYYDEFGKLTAYGKQVKKMISKALEGQQKDDLEKKQFPSCNIEWNADTGSRVWCTNKSGGIERTWIGVPRQFYETGSKEFRCACIQDQDLELGRIKEYPGCPSDSNECFVKI